MRNTATLIAGTTVFVVTVAALVVLALAGLPAGELLGFATPVVSSLMIAGYVSHVTGAQNQKLDRIDDQTNGKLDKRIHDQVRKALDEHENG